MIQHAQTELPNECCGLLAGVREGKLLRVRTVHRLVNELASPTKYLSDGASMFKAERAMREAGHEIIAVYHSHPTSEPIPSRTDLEWEYYTDLVHFIIGLSGPEPTVRGWWLGRNEFHEAFWEIAEA
jgi:proteasome lid subunit RPN8/RPN11